MTEERHGRASVERPDNSSKTISLVCLSLITPSAARPAVRFSLVELLCAEGYIQRR